MKALHSLNFLLPNFGIFAQTVLKMTANCSQDIKNANPIQNWDFENFRNLYFELF
jgi:hypothetical protein